MRSKKRAKGPKRWPILLALLVGLIVGAGLAIYTEPLPPSVCAKRILEVGGPPAAIGYICYGRPL